MLSKWAEHARDCLSMEQFNLFQYLWEALFNPIFLILSNIGMPFMLHMDASKYSMGVTLLK